MMNTVTGLALGRIAAGVASIAKPDLVAPSMGQGTSAPLLTQWFGSREIALGALTLVSGGSARRNLVLVGMAVDATDAATTYAAVEAKVIEKRLGTMLMAVAVGAVLSGLLGLRVTKKKSVEAV
ncbi:MAG: hypothetical protein M3237_20960 [Actinomycetota bacterium]|nr:hypothetical protein [Actinomycetota bacterium]